MHPSQFTVNQCWLVIKASDVPISTDEGFFDVYVLQDAASMYLFGSVFTPLGTGDAPEEEVNSLFQGAWRAKQEWPKRLLLPDSIPSPNSFTMAANQNQIPVEIVPESALAIYVNDVQAGFREHFERDETGTA
jgi:hypothetical protein